MEVGKTAVARAEAVEASTRKLIFETVLTDDKVKFGFDTSDLSPEAQSAIDEFAGQLKTDAGSSSPCIFSSVGL